MKVGQVFLKNYDTQDVFLSPGLFTHFVQACNVKLVKMKIET